MCIFRNGRELSCEIHCSHTCKTETRHIPHSLLAVCMHFLERNVLTLDFSESKWSSQRNVICRSRPKWLVGVVVLVLVLVVVVVVVVILHSCVGLYSLSCISSSFYMKLIVRKHRISKKIGQYKLCSSLQISIPLLALHTTINHEIIKLFWGSGTCKAYRLQDTTLRTVESVMKHAKSRLRCTYKVKLFLGLTKLQRHEDVRGSGVTAPYILTVGTRRRWEVSPMPRPLYPAGKEPLVPTG
jgi:hypothetical protein